MKTPKRSQFIPGLVLFFFIIVTIFSCKKDKLYGDVVVDPQLIEKLYSNAKDTIKIDNQKLVLEVELYRDYMPGGVQKKNTRLFAPIYIVNIDSLTITNKFEIKTLYVFNKEQIWVSNPVSNEGNLMPKYKSFRISKNGPEWETGIYVDVVAVIVDLITGNINYLIARNQLIMRLD